MVPTEPIPEHRPILEELQHQYLHQQHILQLRLLRRSQMQQTTINESEQEVCFSLDKSDFKNTCILHSAAAACVVTLN